MKSIDSGKSHRVRNITVSRAARFEGADDRKERAVTDSVLTAAFVVIVALCLVLSVGIYRWSHYAPIFSPDGAAGPSIEEAMPY